MLDRNKRLEELAKDKEFIEKLAKLDSVEAVTEALNEAGAEVTVEEMQRGLEYYDAHGDELSEEALETVAGGVPPIVGVIMIWSAVCFLIGCVHGFANYYNKKR